MDSPSAAKMDLPILDPAKVVPVFGVVLLKKLDAHSPTFAFSEKLLLRWSNFYFRPSLCRCRRVSGKRR
jgi:hypothetical protein